MEYSAFSGILVVTASVVGFRHQYRKPWLTGATDHLITLKRKAVVAGDHVGRNRQKGSLFDRPQQTRNASTMI